MPAEFIVHEPIAFKPTKAKRGVVIDKASIESFWKTAHGDIGSMTGIYVFALRRGKGYTPYYIGKADRQTFIAETFTPRNVNAYQDVVSKEHGTPIFIFLERKSARGPNSAAAIKEIEKDLIAMAYAKNPNGLINRHHANKKESNYSIKGVLNSRPGKPSTLAQSFKKMMGIV